jgi:hypothetical protein
MKVKRCKVYDERGWENQGYKDSYCLIHYKYTPYIWLY